ncbi:hypothetical protein NVP2275O_003 [Vibrio phage 2.275.O._10N.286.54.E11]|nr:hypothetical protein NVP2275O_003 [Vibrio phage 2.275.O._10N.286.54.E11]
MEYNMAIEQDKLGLEVYKILSAQGYGFTLSMYDADGQGTITPLTARWIYVKPQDIMIVLPEQNKPTKPEIFLWKHQDTSDELILQIIDRLRVLANQFGVGLTVNDFSHDDAPKAFAKKAEKDRVEAALSESYLAEGLTGTAKRSYLQLENARMIVVHSKRIDEEVHGSRSRHVKDIFIENSSGERYRYPTRYLPGARCMTRHISMGGQWNDKVGKTIQESGKEIKAYRMLIHEAELNNCPRLVFKAKQYIKEVKSMTRKMQGPRGYCRLAESIMSVPAISKVAITNRSKSLNALSGLNESTELLEAYQYMARRDIKEDMKNLEMYTKVIQEAMIDISPNMARKTSRYLIKGNLGAKGKVKPLCKASNPMQKVAIFASALSEAVANDVICIVLSEIAEKAEPSAEDAKFVSGVYKTLRLNEILAPTQEDEAQDLLEWTKTITNKFL